MSLAGVLPRNLSRLRRPLFRMFGVKARQTRSKVLGIHGGAVLDYAENVSRGEGHWREPYLTQGEQKQSQVNQMIRYAESNQCRMSALVCHFGDLADGQKTCGICDFCAPQRCASHRFRTATEAERAALFR